MPAGSLVPISHLKLTTEWLLPFENLSGASILDQLNGKSAEFCSNSDSDIIVFDIPLSSYSCSRRHRIEERPPPEIPSMQRPMARRVCCHRRSAHLVLRVAG